MVIKKRKSSFKAFGFVILCAGLLSSWLFLILFNVFIREVVLHRIVSEFVFVESSGKYFLEISDIDFNLYSQTFDIDNAYLIRTVSSPQENERNAGLLRIGAGNVQLSGFRPFHFLFLHKLIFRKFIIDNPIVDIIVPKNKASDTIHVDRGYSGRGRLFPDVIFKELEINHGQAKIYSNPGDTLCIHDFSLTGEEIVFHEYLLNDDISPLEFQNIEFCFNDIELHSLGVWNDFKVKSLSYNSESSDLRILEIQALQNSGECEKSLHIPEILLENMSFKTILSGIHLNKISVNNAFLCYSIPFPDKTDTDHKDKKAIIHSSNDFPVSTDSLLIRDLYLHLTTNEGAIVQVNQLDLKSGSIDLSSVFHHKRWASDSGMCVMAESVEICFPEYNRFNAGYIGYYGSKQLLVMSDGKLSSGLESGFISGKDAINVEIPYLRLRGLSVKALQSNPVLLDTLLIEKMLFKLNGKLASQNEAELSGSNPAKIGIPKSVEIKHVEISDGEFGVSLSKKNGQQGSYKAKFGYSLLMGHLNTEGFGRDAEGSDFPAERINLKLNGIIFKNGNDVNANIRSVEFNSEGGRVTVQHPVITFSDSDNDKMIEAGEVRVYDLPWRYFFLVDRNSRNGHMKLAEHGVNGVIDILEPSSITFKDINYISESGQEEISVKTLNIYGKDSINASKIFFIRGGDMFNVSDTTISFTSQRLFLGQWQFFEFDSSLIIRELCVYGPDVTLWKSSSIKKHGNVNLPLNVFSLDTLYIIDGKFRYYNSTSQVENQALAEGQINFRGNDIKIIKPFVRGKFPEFTGEYLFSIGNFRGGHHTSRWAIGETDYNSGEESLNFTDISYFNRESKDFPIVVDEVIVDEVLLKGVNPLQIINSSDISVRDIFVKNPNLRISYFPDSSSHESKKFSEGESFRGIQIDNFQISGGSIVFNQFTDTGMIQRMDVKEFALGFRGFQYNPGSEGYFGHKMSITDGSFRIPAFSLATQGGMYNIGFEKCELKSFQDTLTIDSFYLHPNYSKYSFAKVLGYQTDRMNISVSRIELLGVDYFSIFSGEVYINKILIKDPAIEGFRDKSIPFPETQRRKLPVSMLNSITIPLRIDSVRLIDGKIRYYEHVEGSKYPGEVYFSRINGTIENVVNRGMIEANDSMMKALITGRLMGEGILNAEILFPLHAENDTFQLSASLGNMDLTSFSEMTRNLFGVEIKKGWGSARTLKLNGNNDYSTGELLFPYEKLRISLYNREKGKKRGVSSELLAFLANELVLKSNNPRLLRNLKTGTIYAKRDYRKSYFNFVWKSTLCGIESTLGFSNKDLREYQKSIKKMQDKKRTGISGKIEP
ncbi:MAG: hypothetical protein KKA81_12960 [Bacteroidetes bacterium]|nr:hypothetical protein [Bacteroidota bacterium]